MTAGGAGATLRVPAVLMRGGTSRGLVFRREDLPTDTGLRDAIFLAALGSPDVRQLDGVGAGDSHTSKVAVVNRSDAPDADIDYLFGEVGIREARVDYAGNSGNIITALGLWALEEGVVAATEPETRVRVRNVNTGKTTIVYVPVRGGRPAEDGDFAIDGVPGAGPRIDLEFPDPAGALTGRLLPAGGPVTRLEVPGVGAVDATLLDSANPVVIVPGGALGLAPETPVAAVNADAELRSRLQAARAAGAVRMGLVERPEDAWGYSPMIPFLVLVFPPADHPSFTDPALTIRAEDMDVCARVISLDLMHKAINVTVSVAVTSAALVPGTLVERIGGAALRARGELRIGHPSGRVSTRGRLGEPEPDGTPRVDSVRIGRTARRIMQGEVLVQPHKLRQLGVAAPAPAAGVAVAD